MTSRRNGVLLCLIATLFWGGMFPIMDSALRHIDAFSFTCLRYLVAGTLFVITLAVVEGRKSFDLKGEKVLLAWVFGTAGFTGFQFLVFYGQHLIGKGGALVASIIMATMPMQAFFVNWCLKKVVPPRFVLVFIGISLVGIVLVLTKGDLSTLAKENRIGPMLLILFAAFCWVVYTSGASGRRHSVAMTGLVSQVMAAAGSRAAARLAWAMLVLETKRMAAMAILRRVARITGAWPVRARLASSPKVTSRIFSRGRAVCGGPACGVCAGQGLAVGF